MKVVSTTGALREEKTRHPPEKRVRVRAAAVPALAGTRLEAVLSLGAVAWRHTRV